MALAPRYTASVQPTAAPTGPGTQGANTAPGQQDALGLVKQLVRQSSQAASYDPVYNNIYEDKTLQEFKEQSSEGSEDQINYFRQHAAAWIVQFVQEAKIYRHGVMYATFRDIVENYPSIRAVNSHVKAEFIKFLVGRNDLLDVVAIRTSVWFGFIMAKVIKDANGQPPRQAVLHSVRTATENILNLEIVTWLNGSNKAAAFLYSPTPEIQELLSKFNMRKDAASKVFQFFEESSPYDAANFSGERMSEGNITNIMPEVARVGMDQRLPASKNNGMTDMTGTYVPDYHDGMAAEDRELLRISFDLMRKNNQTPGFTNQPPPRATQRDSYDDLNIYGTSGQRYRTDIENIDIHNRHLFDLRSYFTATVCENWWTVKEGDWTFLKRAMKRRGGIRAEDTIVKGCIRFVEYDFDHENSFPGWRTRAIRFTNQAEKDMILSDPAKLLPHLDVDSFQNKVVVLPVTEAKAFFDEEGRKLGDDAEVFEKLREPGFEFRVIDTEDSIRTGYTKDVFDRMIASGTSIAEETQKPLAMLGEFDITGRFMFEDRQSRDVVVAKFPMMFHGYEGNADNSYFGIIESIARQLARTPIDDENTPEGNRFDTFVSGRLTMDLNDWLVNAAGYSLNPKDGESLTVDNILLDYNELKTVLLQTDKTVYDILNQVGPDSLVKSLIEMFDRPVTPAETMSPVDREEHAMSLIRSRHYRSIVIHNEPGPKPTVGKPITLRRSNNPEFFTLIDTLRAHVQGKGQQLETQSILMMYKYTNDLFMVTPTVYDENVLTIRTVKPSRTFLSPAFG